MEERPTGPIRMTARPGVTELLKQLIQIGIALTSERELSTLLERIVAEARRFTNAEAGTLFSRSEDELRFAVTQNDALAERIGDKEIAVLAGQPLCLTEPSLAGYVALPVSRSACRTPTKCRRPAVRVQPNDRRAPAIPDRIGAGGAAAGAER